MAQPRATSGRQPQGSRASPAAAIWTPTKSQTSFPKARRPLPQTRELLNSNNNHRSCDPLTQQSSIVGEHDANLKFPEPSQMVANRYGHFHFPNAGMMSIEQFDSKLKNTEVLRIMRHCTDSRRTRTEQDCRNLLQDLCEHLAYSEAVQLLNRFVFNDTKELELSEKDGGYLVSNKYSNMDPETYQAILKNQPAVAKIMKSCKNRRLTATTNGYMSALRALSMHVTMQESIQMLNYFGSITLLKDTDLENLFKGMKSREGFTDAFNFVLSHATQPNQKTVVIRGIPVILFHSWRQTLTPPDEEMKGDDDGEEEHDEDDIGDDNSSKDTSSTHLRLQYHVAPATVQLRFGNSNFQVMTFGMAEPHSRITSSKLYVGWDLEGFFCLVDPAATGCYGDQKLAFARLHGPNDVEVKFGDQPDEITLHHLKE